MEKHKTTALLLSDRANNYSIDCSKIPSLNWTSSTIKDFETTYTILSITTSFLSIIGSLLIIYFYYKVPSLKTPSRKLLVYLSICDLGIAIGNMSGAVWQTTTNGTAIFEQSSAQEDKTDSFCKIQAIVTSTSSIASFFWTMFIALNAYMIVIHGQKALLTNLKWLPHAISWGVPVITIALVAGYDRYGYDPCSTLEWWCWIQPHWTYRNNQPYDPMDMMRWELVSGKFWELLSYLFVIIMYNTIRYRLNKHIKSLNRHRQESSQSTGNVGRSAVSQTFANANRKLFFVPAVFIVARMWGTCRFILDLLQSGTCERIAAVISLPQSIGDSAQGFMNCVVFVLLTPVLREKLPCYHWSIFKRFTRMRVPPATLDMNDSSDDNSQFAGNYYGSIVNSRSHTPTETEEGLIDTDNDDERRLINIHQPA